MTAKKENMTIEDLAQMATKGFEDSEKKMKEKFKEADKQMDKKLEKLATLVQNGFLELKGEIQGVKSDTKDIKTNLNKKVDRFEHNELVYRVEKLEKNFS